MRHPVSCKIFQIKYNVLKILRLNPKSAHCALEEDRKNNARADRARAKSITSDTADTLDWAVYFVYKCIRIFLAKCIRIRHLHISLHHCIVLGQVHMTLERFRTFIPFGTMAAEAALASTSEES